LKEAQALRDLANAPAAFKRAGALQPEVDATGYGPLRAELLELIGSTDTESRRREKAEATLHEALFIAEAARDDATAARIATDLVCIGVLEPKRRREAETWFRLSESILDRLGSAQDRTRGWAFNNFALVRAHDGDVTGAIRLLRRAVTLKEHALGKDHPDVAISLGNLASFLGEDGHPAEALEVSRRAVDILLRNGDPESPNIASARDAAGTSLIALGRSVEAESLFQSELQRLRQQDASGRALAFALQGVGASRLAMGEADAAIPFLEDALQLREAREPTQYNVAETRFSLARALCESEKDRRRALKLAAKARDFYAAAGFRRQERAVAEWLATHKPAQR
jgi:tetratricopeptide (TPR) repeat protein